MKHYYRPGIKSFLLQDQVKFIVNCKFVSKGLGDMMVEMCPVVEIWQYHFHRGPRRHPSPRPNGVFPVSENASDMDRYSACVKGQLWTMSGPDSVDMVLSSCEETTA